MKPAHRRSIAFLGAALLSGAGLAACGGGGSSAPYSPATPGPSPSVAVTAVPTASPAPPVPQASLVTLNVTSNAPLAFSVTESGYSGAFTERDTCNPLTGEIATVAATTSGPRGAYTVTPIGPGTCQITVSDASGGSTGVSVAVSAAVITVH